jgi:hypothetical protein
LRLVIAAVMAALAGPRFGSAGCGRRMGFPKLHGGLGAACRQPGADVPGFIVRICQTVLQFLQFR